MASKTDFTEREMQLMALAWRCFEEQPKINFQRLADLASMSNPKSASNAWIKIKQKLAAQADAVANGGDAAADGVSTPKVKATPKKRGKKAADEDGDDEETPAKKKRTPAKKGKKSATPEEDDAIAAAEENGAKVKAEAGEEDDAMV